MQYLIGELLKEYLTKNDIVARRLGIDTDIHYSTISFILNGKRTAREPILSKLMNTETLKDPLKKYIKETIDTLDTATLIDVYNTIYNNKKDDINK